jgi:uncharacterized protein YqjF (DUF2071 family)
MQRIDHRPWPMPARPWLWRQRWDRVLLMHWRVPAKRLRPWLPKGLSLDEHDGSAWISLVPFLMRGVRPRGLLPFGPVSDFVELNLRTYVTANDRPGVYFLRIDAGSFVSAWLGRLLSPLPYRFANMSFAPHGSGISFRSPNLTVHFGEVHAAAESTVCDHWLIERYCMYAAPAGRLMRAEVHHAPWPILKGRVRIQENAALASYGVKRPLHPDLLHLSPGVEIAAWSAELVSRL